MNLILAIHPDVNIAPKSLEIIEEAFQRNPKTHVIYFSWGLKELDLAFEQLKSKGNPDNFYFLHTPITASIVKFSDYEKEFLETLKKVGKNLSPGEKINVSSFGGFANRCYERISPHSHAAIKKAFPNSISRVATDLRGMYGRSLGYEAHQPRKKSPKRNVRRDKRK